MFLVNKYQCKTHYEPSSPSDHLYYQWNGDDSESKETLTENRDTVNIDNNILGSVNDILDSFEDEHILNSMLEDIVEPVIKEAIVREKEKSKQNDIEDDSYGKIFRKHKKNKGITRRPAGLSERYKYKGERLRPSQLDRDFHYHQHQPLLVPITETRYVRRLRRGMARIASSAPVWQQFLQLVAAGLLVFLLPGSIYIG